MRDGGGTDRGATTKKPLRRASAVVLLAALGIAPACASDDPEQTPVEAFCSGICEAAIRCRLADTTCTGNCARSSPVERFSSEAARHLGDCLTDLPCSAFSDETVWTDEFDACWQATKPLVPVTERVRSVCSREVEAIFECNSLYSTRDCEMNLRMWSDDVLDGVVGCLPAADCAELEACLKGVFASP